MSFQQQVQATADRISAEEVGMDPATILIILTTVLPQLFSCLADNDLVSASEVQSRVAIMNEKNRPRLIKRTVLAVKREHRRDERTKPKRLRRELTDAQALAMATAIIDQTLEAPSQEVRSASHYCHAATKEA